MSDLAIGTRGSTLALWQARHVADLLRAAVPGIRIEIREIKTAGDKLIAGRSTEPLPKGLFTRQIESALLDRSVDLAVHSLKDLPVEIPDGLALGATPFREDVADVLATRDGSDLDGLEPGSVVGTGSLRRRAFLLAMRPDLAIEPIRGNVPTRLKKLGDGYDAVVLARAGLARLGLEEHIAQVFPPDIFPPAPGQGALGLEIREDDRATAGLIETIDHPDTRSAVTAERAFLDGLGGGCRLPIGAWGRIENGRLLLDGAVADPDGRVVLRERTEGDPDQADEMGRRLARQLMERGARNILERING